MTKKTYTKLYVSIIGTRRRDSEEDLAQVEKAFLDLLEEQGLQPSEVSIVSGHCPAGGDRFAEILIDKYDTAEGKDWIFPAGWNRLDEKGPNGENPVIKKNRWGKEYNILAGFWRNTDIANKGDFIIACVASDRTGGTEDTIKKAEALGKQIILV